MSTIWTHVGPPSKHRQANKPPSPSLVDTTRGGGSVSGTRSSKLIAQVGSKINFAAACRHRVKLLLPISVDLVPCMSLAPQVCSRAARKAAPQQKCDTGNCFFLFSAALVECAISCDSVCSLDRRPSRAVAGWSGCRSSRTSLESWLRHGGGPRLSWSATSWPCTASSAACRAGAVGRCAIGIASGNTRAKLCAIAFFAQSGISLFLSRV